MAKKQNKKVDRDYNINRLNNQIVSNFTPIYAYGGQPIKIQDPSEAILRGQQNVINAQLDAERKSKGWKIAGDILSTASNNILGSMGVPGADMLNNVNGLTKGLATGDMDFNDFGKGILSTGLDYGLSKLQGKLVPKMAMGGNPPEGEDPLKTIFNYNGISSPIKIKGYRTYNGKPVYYVYQDYDEGKEATPLGNVRMNEILKQLEKNNKHLKGMWFNGNDKRFSNLYDDDKYETQERYDQGRVWWSVDKSKGQDTNIAKIRNKSNFSTFSEPMQQAIAYDQSKNRNVESLGGELSDTYSRFKKRMEESQNANTQELHDYINNSIKSGTLPKKAYGGTVENIPIEAEGGELLETPDGQLGEIQGYNHEEGGVPMEVPQDSVIYSKRLKGADGKSMAKRKKFREKYLSKLEKLIKLNPNDKVLKRTYEKTLKDFEKQEQEDVEYMNYMNEISNSKQEISQDNLPLENNEEELPIMATGGNPKRINKSVEIAKIPQLTTPKFNLNPQVVENPMLYKDKPFTGFGKSDYYSTLEGETIGDEPLINDNNKVSTNENDDVYFGDIFPYTAGDLLSMYGMYKSGTDPLKLTQQQRAGDTPNINYYQDYGKKGLQRLEETKDFVTGQHNKNLADLITERDTAIARNRAGARGINTQRALDLATDVQNYKAQNNAYMNYLSQINQIMGMEANVLNQIDQRVMQGDEKKDLADRQDRDNYYTQLQRDTRYKNKMLQSMGQFLNDVKERQHTENMINTYSDKYIYKNGKVVALKKDVEDPEFQYWKGATKGQQDIWNKAVSEKGYKFEDGVFYNDKGEEVDHLDKNLKVKKNGRKNVKIVEETKKEADIVRKLYKNVFDGTDYTDEEVLEILKNKDKLSTIKLKSGREVNMQDIDIDNSFDKDIEEYVTSNGKRKISNKEYISRILKGEDLSHLIPVRSSDYYEDYKTDTFYGKVKTYVYDQNGEVQKDKNGKKMTKEVTYSNEKLNLAFKELAKIYKEETGEKFNPNNLNEKTLEKVGKILKKDEKLTKDDLIKLLLNIK